MRYSKAITVLALVISITIATRASAQEGPEAPPVRQITLEQALELTAASNPGYQNIGEAVSQADTLISSAWTMLLPKVTATGSIVRNQDEIVMEMPDFSAFDPTAPDAPLPTGQITIQEKWGNSFGFAANMTLFDPRSIPLIKNAYTNEERARLEGQRLRNELLFAVTSAYYQAYAMQEMVGVWQQNLSTADEFHGLARARQSAGDSTSIDVLRAEIEVIEARKGLLNAKDSASLARSGLGYLMNLNGAFELVNPSAIASIDSELKELQKQALQRRVDVKEAELTEEMAARMKTEVLMRWLPSFNATFNWQWNEAEGFAGEHSSWMVIFGATWNLFEGGDRIAQVKLRESDIRVAQNQVNQTMLDIRRDVEETYVEMRGLARNLALLDKQVALAEENHALLAKQFEVGLATSLDLKSAFTDLTSMRTAKVVEALQFDIAKLRLLKAAGQYHDLASN